MAELVYNGKTYIEPSTETLAALKSVDIYTFRYYLQDEILIASDYFVEAFHTPKVITNMPQGIADCLIHRDDWDVLFDMNRNLLNGERKVVGTLRTQYFNITSKVTISIQETDETGRPTVAVGIVENLEEDLRMAAMVKALSDNYQSVYYVDFEQNYIIPYRLSTPIANTYGDYFRTRPTYEAAIKAYIENTVFEDDKDEMKQAASLENLQEQLKDKNVYSYDYRAQWDDEISFFRMKVVNLSKRGELTVAVMGFANVDSEKQRDLEKFAYTDRVTGGYNYLRFKEQIKEQEASGSIVAMDIHSFKIINSVCGEKKGDEVLKSIYNSILDSLEDGEFSGHLGSDQFVIYLKDKEEGVIRNRIEKLYVKICSLSMDLSVPPVVPYFGVCEITDTDDVENIYTQANAAKRQLRDRKDMFCFFYSEKDVARITEEKRMENSFESAIENEEFILYYQPKYSPGEKKLVGAEALVRWRKPDGSLVPPGRFIPLFERDGLIRNLDEYVFRKVCHQLKEWQDKGVDIVPISVNLSRASLYYEQVAEKYIQIAKEEGISTKWIPIEITESAAISNENAKRIAEQFYKGGFPLHMDDFGTGYSSLAALNILHFDTLKIDKSLVDFIGNYGGDRLLVHTISLAKELGMNVVAEGVELDTQVDFLNYLNCDGIQGYIFSKPLPVEEFTEELSSSIHVVGLSNQSEKDLRSRKACIFSDVINEVIEKEKKVASAVGKNLISSMFVINDSVYLDIEKFEQVLQLVIDNSIQRAGNNECIVLSVHQDPATEAGYASYEFVMMVPKTIFTPADSDSIRSFEAFVCAKELIDRMGGSIVFSIETNGTLNVKIRFALKIVHENANNLKSYELAMEKKIKEYASEKTVLLVEDNELNRTLTAEVLAAVGFRVEVAEDGHQAIEQIAKKPAKYYSLVLMDLLMPNMDGYQATKEIRKLNNRPDLMELPIIALSSNAMEVDVKQAYESGMNGHVAKPLGVKALTDIILNSGI